MRLYSFRVRNFRSIIDTGEVKISEIDNITILAGQNEAGKSSILEALDFLENGPSDVFEEEQRRLGSFPEVECHYRLTKDELEHIKNKTSKEVAEHLKANGVTYRRGTHENNNDQESLLFVYSTVLKEKCEKLLTVDETGAEIKYTLDDLIALIKPMRPEFILYSSFESSILPPKIKRSQLGDNSAVDDFEKVYDIDFKSLLDDTSDRSREQKLEELNRKASENLNQYWTQEIGEQSNYRYKINAYPQEAAPESSYIVFSIDRGDNHPLSIGQKSTGFRWFASFTLRLRAHEVSFTEPGKFILLIDEPGQGLHEEAQKNVLRVLNETGERGWQLIYTTHLPQLLGGAGADLSRIKLVLNSLDKGTRVKNIAQATSDAGFMDALSPVRSALGQITIDVNTFLNGKTTVVLEGITDYYYLKGWSLLLKRESRFSFVPPVGVTQTPNVYAILLGWGISPSVIIDDGRAGTQIYNKMKKTYFENEDDKAKERIYINAGAEGIEDTFEDIDFNKFASVCLPAETLRGTGLNSEKARGKKEIIARTFLDKVKDRTIKWKDLSETTQQRVKLIFEFLDNQ